MCTHILSYLTFPMCSWNFFICFHWADPWTHIPFTFWPHFACKFSHHRDNKSFILRPGSQSNTVLVFHDFNETYNIITQLRLIDLHNFSENSQFLGASKIFLLEWTSLNARTIKHTLLSFAYPPIYTCISYYCIVQGSVLSQPQESPFSFPSELKITM